MTLIKGSQIPPDIKECLITILDQLSPEVITRKIENPIDTAYAEFQLSRQEAITQPIFNKAISALVKSIYGKALRFPRRLSDREALAEAIHLLGHVSEVEGPDRYDALLAIVSAGGSEELEQVLLNLSGVIKELEKRKYIQWVFTHHFKALAWQKQCEVVSCYTKFLFQGQMPVLQEKKPEQLLPQFELLLMPNIPLRDLVIKILSLELKRSQPPIR